MHVENNVLKWRVCISYLHLSRADTVLMNIEFHVSGFDHWSSICFCCHRLAWLFNTVSFLAQLTTLWNKGLRAGYWLVSMTMPAWSSSIKKPDHFPTPRCTRSGFATRFVSGHDTVFFVRNIHLQQQKKPNKWIRLAEQQTRLISVFKKSGVFVFEYWVTKGVKTNMSKNTSTYEIASFSSLHPPHQKRGSFWDNLCGNSFPASCALWHFSCDFARVAVIFQHLTFAEDTAKVLKGFIDVFGI